MNFLTRRKIAVVVAEALGTAVLTTVFLAVSRSAIGVPYFVALGLALAVVMLVQVLGSVSGVHVNPAVTVGLWSARQISTIRAVVYVAAQFAGAVGAYSLYNYLVADGTQNIAGADFEWRVLVAEMVGALLWSFGVAAAVYQGQLRDRMAATVGVSVAVAIIVAGIASNGIANPAVALGVDSWSKAYVVGPLLGGVVGVNLYALLFADRVSLARSASVASRTKRSVAKKPVRKTRK